MESKTGSYCDETRYAVRDEDCHLDSSSGKCQCLERWRLQDSDDEGEGRSNNNDKEDEGKANGFFQGWPEELDGLKRELAEEVFGAVEDGDTDRVLEVLEECRENFPEEQMLSLLNVRRMSNENDFPLAVAASMDDVAMMELLIENGCCLKCQTNRNESALHIAAMQGRLGAVEVLLSHGLDVFLHVSNFHDELLVDELLQEMIYEAVQDGEHFAALEAVAVRLLDAGAFPSPVILAKAMDNLELFSESMAEKLEQYMEITNSGERCLAVVSDYFSKNNDDDDGAPGEGEQEGKEAHLSGPSCTIDIPCVDDDNKRLFSEEEKHESQKRLEVASLCVTIPPKSSSLGEYVIASPPSSISPSKKRYTNSHRVLVASPRSANTTTTTKTPTAISTNTSGAKLPTII